MTSYIQQFVSTFLKSIIKAPSILANFKRKQFVMCQEFITGYNFMLNEMRTRKRNPK
jgi:hypothetical protein